MRRLLGTQTLYILRERGEAPILGSAIKATKSTKPVCCFVVCVLSVCQSRVRAAKDETAAGVLICFGLRPGCVRQPINLTVVYLHLQLSIIQLFTL